MPRHPDAQIRSAIRLLSMVGELHKQGYQGLRVMPYLYATGHWRCEIAPATLFYRNHGAIYGESGKDDMIARYSIAAGKNYFGWKDTGYDDARALAEKFVQRFITLSVSSIGWDYVYAGWHQQLLGYAERGWLPYVFSEYKEALPDRLYLMDVRPQEWRSSREEVPVLPLPPHGKLQQDYAFGR